MPLMDPHTCGEQRVTCMDIDENASMLICGYQDGGLALWDLQEYKLLKYIPDFHETVVTNIKISGVS